MKKLPALFFVIFSLSGYAQTIHSEIKYEPQYRKNIQYPSGEEFTGFADGENSIVVHAYGMKANIYTFHAMQGHAEHSLQIRKVSPDGKEIVVNNLENGEKKFGPLRTIALEYQQKLVLIYAKFLNNSKLELFQSEIDRTTLALINTKSLYQFPLTDTRLLRNGNMYKTVFVEESPDKKHLLVAATGIEEQFFTAVLDKDLDITQTHIAHVKGTEKIQLHEVAIADNGTIAASFLKHDLSKSQNENEQYKAMRGYILNPDKKELQINFEADNTERALYRTTLLITKDGSKAIFAGDYHEKHFREGLWLKEIATATLDETNTQRIPYPAQFLNLMKDMKFANKRRGLIGMNATSYQLIELPDNQFLLGGSPVGTVESYDGTRYDKTSFAGPVNMVFLDQQRKPVITTIPRHNRLSAAITSKFIPYKDKLIVLYNDFEENIKAPFNPERIKQKGFGNIKELSLGAAVINTNREVESRKLLGEGTGRMHIYLLTKATYKSPFELFIPASKTEAKKKRYQIVHVTIE